MQVLVARHPSMVGTEFYMLRLQQKLPSSPWVRHGRCGAAAALYVVSAPDVSAMCHACRLHHVHSATRMHNHSLESEYSAP